MKTETIRVAKTHRPLTAETVLSDLKKMFPDYEAIPIDDSGKAILVKQSGFAGARIDIEHSRILLQGKVPRPLARVVDLALLGTISSAKNPKVVGRLKRFLRNQYIG